MRRVSVVRRVRMKLMPPPNFRRPRAVRDSSRFLSLSVVLAASASTSASASAPAGSALTLEAAEADAEAAAAGRRVRWSGSSFGAGDGDGDGDSVGRGWGVEEPVVPAKPAALRVPWTDVLSILVNDFVGGVVVTGVGVGVGAGAGAGDEGCLCLLVGAASSDGREGAREGI